MLLNQQTRSLPVHWRILVVSWLGWLFAFTSLMLFYFLSGRYRGDLSLDDQGVAWVKGLALGATGVGGLLFGVLGDRLGRKPALWISLGLCVGGLLLAAVAPNSVWMTASSPLAGLGIGGQWAAGQTLVGETVPPRLRGRFGAVAQSGAPLGLGLATLLAFELGHALGWRGVFLLASAAVLLIPVVLLFLPESDVWLALRASRRRGEKAARSELRQLFAPEIRGLFLAAFLLTLLSMANYWFTLSWLPESMERTWGLTLRESGTWTLVFVVGALLGYLAFALTAERLGRRPAFSLFCGLTAAAVASLTLLEGPIRHRPSLALLFAFLAGVGTGFWGCFGPLFTEIFPTRVRNTAAGISYNVSRAALFAAPWVVVAVGEESLLSGVALAALFAVGAGACVWLLPETGGRRLEEAEVVPGPSLQRGISR